MKQHTEATKTVSAQRGLTWPQNAIPQLIRKASGWPALMLGPNLRAAVYRRKVSKTLQQL